MVRTKADVGSTRVSAAKAPRKITGGASSHSSPSGKPGSSKDKFSGGNSYNPQPVPKWQKGIDGFFSRVPKASDDEDSSNGEASTSAQ